MEFEDCLERGFIIRNNKAKDRVRNSIEISKKFLGSAKKNFDIKEYETTVLLAYNSIFHTSRALLFNKGYVEKSHFCLIIALRNLYKEDKHILDFLNAIDKVRLSRHEIQYRGVFADDREARFVLDLARQFLDYAKNLLKC